MRRMFIIITTLLLFVTLSNGANAAGAWTAKAIPTHIESIRGQGFMIFGAFGNPGTACGSGDSIWIAITHPQYDQLYSMAVSALMGGKELRGYPHVCTAMGWHAGTFNEINASGTLYIFK